MTARVAEALVERMPSLCAGLDHPSDEVRRVVALAWLDGVQHAVVLAPGPGCAPLVVNRRIVQASDDPPPFAVGYQAGAQMVLDGLRDLSWQASALEREVLAGGAPAAARVDAMLRHPAAARIGEAC